MLMELNIVPLGHGESFSADLAEVLKIIDESGLDYRLTASGTNIEGGWEELMDVARLCHKEMRKKARRVVTTIRIDDYGERADRLAAMVRSVEAKAGKPLRK